MIYNFLEFISPLMVVLAFLVLQRGRKLQRHWWILFLYFILSTINLGFATYLAIYNIPNLIWYNLNGFCSLLLLSMFFHSLVRGKRYKQVIGLLSAGGLVTYAVLLFGWHDNTAFFSSGYAVSSLLIIVYCLLFLNEVFTEQEVLTNHTDETIGVVSGLFTYFLCAYVIQVGYRYFTWLYTNKKVNPFFDNGTLWGIHNVIYFLACFIILIHLVRMRKEEYPV